MTSQSGMSGSNDKSKKKPRHSKERNDKAENLEEIATTNESESPRTDTSGDVSDELLLTPSGILTPPQDDADLMQSIFTNPGLSEHRYISLMEFSPLRAFIQNAELLAIDPELFIDDNALSPWTTSNPYPTLMPHDLSPTPFQLATPHHPYIDLIAPPSLRNNLIASDLTEEQENLLCFDVHNGSFMIWGSQPWSAFGM